MCAVVALVVASPALRPGQPDGYPLSTYPMFARARGSEVAVATAVGVGAEGATERLDPHVIGGTDEVMQAASTMSAAVRAGDADLERLCAEIAGRLAGRDDAPLMVQIRSEVHAAVAWFDGRREPLDVVVHHECEVPA